MDELAINLSPKRVDNRYLQVLIVGEAVIAKMLSQFFAVLDSLQIAFKIDADPVSQRDAVFHIEKEFLHLPPPNRFNKDQLRASTIGKGLPRFRALARMTVMERFSETAILAADEPPSISAIRCAVWAAVHFRLSMRTMCLNSIDQVSFRPDLSVDCIAPAVVCEFALNLKKGRGTCGRVKK